MIANSQVLKKIFTKNQDNILKILTFLLLTIITRMHYRRMHTMAVSLATYAHPLPHMPPYHACPPNHARSPCHACPYHACLPCHACPLPYTPPWYTCLPAKHAPCGQTDTFKKTTFPQLPLRR